VLVSGSVYDAFMAGPEQAIELMHGYTYSAHPLACAAGLATLAVHEELGINAHVRQVAPVWQSAALALREQPSVQDIRAIGLLCAVELKSREHAPGARAAEVAQRCFDAGLLVRASGENIVLSPPLIVSEEQIALIFDTLQRVLDQVA
jgi:beta-alanine--pyruvate transaminase